MPNLVQRYQEWSFQRALARVKSVAPDRMNANQLVDLIFGSTNSLPRPGSAALLNMYSTSPWLRAVGQRTSWAVSAVPWTLHVVQQKQSDGKMKAVRRRSIARCTDPDLRIKQYKALRNQDLLREITSHPALDLLDDGNPKFPGQIVTQISQQHLDLVGETFWLMDRNGMGLPSAIWPVPPTWVASRPLDGLGTLDVPNQSYVFTSTTGSRQVPAMDVIRFYHPDPADPYNRASGIGHVLGDELETDEYAAKYTKRWFKNNAIPPLIVALKDTKREDMPRFEDSWKQKLTGRPNIPFFTNRELDVHELNNTFQQMELTQLRKDERDAIIHVFGAPPEIFGIIENSNRSTIDAADYLFSKYVIVPRLEFLRVILQQKLIERYDDRLILDYVSPVVEDKEFKLKVMSASPSAFDVDEFREMGGFGPDLTGAGKGRMVNMGTTWVENLTDLAEVPEAPEGPEPVVEDPTAEDPKDDDAKPPTQ